MHRKLPVVVVVAFVCVGAIACDRPSGDASYQVTDSAGVKLVMNGTEGTWTPDQAWQFKEDLRIESAEDVAGREFGILAGVAVNSRGEIFVLDRSVPNIQHFDSNGSFLGTIGGPGEGPGQFGRMVAGVLVGAGDTLTVPDLGNMRIELFAPDGRFVRSFSLPASPDTPFLWRTLPQGQLAGQVNAMVMPGQAAEGHINVVVRLAPDGVVQDTILSFPLDPILDISQGPTTMKTRVFNSTAAWTTADNGLVAAGMTGEYRLSVYGADGRLRMVFAKQHEPKPVTEADRDRVTAAFKQAFEAQMAKIDNEQIRAAMTQMAGNIEFGETYPAFGAVIAGPDGTWLVRQPITAAEMAGAVSRLPAIEAPQAPPASDVFDADGRFLGTIRFPAGFRLAAVAGGKLYGIETDSLDIPSVIRLARTTGK
ncbi:MAG: hypothetical protein R2910_11760 [Gemmatimonadales bacterium]